MTSPIPGMIAWPVLALLIAITIGRRLLISDSPLDRLINRALGWAILGLILREAWAEKLVAKAVWAVDDSDVINMMRQASFGCILLTVTAIYGIAKVWAGADTADIRRRQWLYDAVGVAGTVIILVVGTPARRHDMLIDQYLGWEAVIAWVVFYAPLAAAALLVGLVCVRELRSNDVTAREKATYYGVLALAIAIGVDSIAIPVVTVLEVINESESADPEMTVKALTFFLACVVAGIVVSVPLISLLLTRTGWDRTGRYCRRLHPLWADLTAAVPEIVLQTSAGTGRGRVDPASRLHRMIVEIRDCLLHLKNYSSTGLELPGSASTRDSDAMTAYAQQIRSAIDLKSRGVTPFGNRGPRRELGQGARDLTAELEQLLLLAKVWPNVRADLRPYARS